jgi:hypothetical protein
MLHYIDMNLKPIDNEYLRINSEEIVTWAENQYQAEKDESRDAKLAAQWIHALEITGAITIIAVNVTSLVEDFLKPRFKMSSSRQAFANQYGLNNSANNKSFELAVERLVSRIEEYKKSCN